MSRCTSCISFIPGAKPAFRILLSCFLQLFFRNGRHTEKNMLVFSVHCKYEGSGHSSCRDSEEERYHGPPRGEDAGCRPRLLHKHAIFYVLT